MSPEYECRDCGEQFDESDADVESDADEIACPGCHSTQIVEIEPPDDAPVEEIIDVEFCADDSPF